MTKHKTEDYKISAVKYYLKERCKTLKEQKLSFKDLKVKIAQFSMDNVFINKYDSIKEAQIATGVNRKNISKMINGKHKSSGGFIWKKL